MSLNYGVCFIPQELGVHRVLKNSRSSASRSNPEVHLQEVSPMWKLMETTHADWFPPRFRKNLRGRHLYEYGAIACEQCKKSVNKRWKITGGELEEYGMEIGKKICSDCLREIDVDPFDYEVAV